MRIIIGLILLTGFACFMLGMTIGRADKEPSFVHLHGYGCAGFPAGAVVHADEEDEFETTCVEIVRVYHAR